MKFAFCLFKYYPYGGLERDFIRIIKACQQRGHDIDVYTMQWRGDLPSKVKVNIVPAAWWTNHSRSASFVKNLRNILNFKSYDAVVGFHRMPGLDVYYAADICFELDVRKRHGWFYRLTGRYKTYSAFERAIFSPQSQTQIIYISDPVKKQYIEIYGTQENRFHLLSPGISRDRIAPENAAEIRKEMREKHKLADEQKLILQIGSDYGRKGVDRSILAVAALPENIRSRTALWIVGKGKAHKYQEMAKRAEVGKNVKFLGESDQVPQLLLAADLLLHPAYREAAGMVLLEAIAAGCSVLVTAACGFAFHVEKAQAGLVVPEPFKQETLNQLLKEMLISDKQGTWKQNALRYAASEDLYSRDEAAKVIEKAAR